jgi:hypothetical protein
MTRWYRKEKKANREGFSSRNIKSDVSPRVNSQGKANEYNEVSDSDNAAKPLTIGSGVIGKPSIRQDAVRTVRNI